MNKVTIVCQEALTGIKLEPHATDNRLQYMARIALAEIAKLKRIAIFGWLTVAGLLIYILFL